MKKAELVSALNDYAERGVEATNGRDDLARFLADYLSELDIPADQKWDFWQIDHHIPQLVLGAFETLRMSEGESSREFSVHYGGVMGRATVDPTDIWGGGVEQSLFVQNLGYMLKDALGFDWLAKEIDMIFNAERHLLEQLFYKFLSRVFQRGLFRAIDESPKRSMSGTFGETTLRTYILAGRLMFTFARPGERAEQNVSFVCGDDDALGLGSGVQTVYTDMQTAIAMINDVITAWPEERSAQAEMFTADGSISIICGVHQQYAPHGLATPVVVSVSLVRGFHFVANSTHYTAGFCLYFAVDYFYSII